MTIVVEWGFQKGTEDLVFDGRIEATQNGTVEKVAPLAGDTTTKMTGAATWQSAASVGSRRGIVASIVYTNELVGPARTIITVRTRSGSFSFLPADLDGAPPEIRTNLASKNKTIEPVKGTKDEDYLWSKKGAFLSAQNSYGGLDGGPILAPEYGFFVARESANVKAQAFTKELASRQLKTIRQLVRKRPEQTLEGAIRAVHGDVTLPEFPRPPYEPGMLVEVPDKYVAALWRSGAWHIIRRCVRIDRNNLKQATAAPFFMSELIAKAGQLVEDPKDPRGIYVVGDHPFVPLGCETDRILWALDHMGMHEVARDGIAVWLENQQPDGALSLNSTGETNHKLGALVLPWVTAEHYRLTGDKEWLKKESPRLKAAVQWIINRRRTTMKEPLSPAEAAGLKTGQWSPYGLQPRIACGDGDPSGSRYYYWLDAFGYQSVKLLADALRDVDPPVAVELAAEAEEWRKQFLSVLNESVVLSPVIRTRGGTYRSFVPQGFQDRGPLSRTVPEEVNVYGHCGIYHGDYQIITASIEAWLRTGLLSVEDPRIDGHFEVLEDAFLLDHKWLYLRKPDYQPEKDWFGNAGWGYQSGWERLCEFYLVKDDVPNFLRSLFNHCAVDLNLKDWSFNEHTTFAANDKSHGKAVFLSNLRNMLVMEIGDALWLARATPRAWLEQGKKIAIKNAPTYFGSMDYAMVADVDNGKIATTIKMPSRKAPKEVWLRLRHPQAAPIKSVSVNGKDWQDFDAAKEVVRMCGMKDTVSVEVKY